jgi:uncharacterized membrane protein
MMMPETTFHLAAFPIWFEEPAWLWFALVVPVLVVVSIRVLRSLERTRRWLAVGCRAGLIALVIACLAGVQHVRESDDLTVMFIMDRSKSIPDDLASGLTGRQEAYVRQIGEKVQTDDRLGVVTFDGQAYVEQLPMRGGFHVDRLPPTEAPDRTDIARAIRLAMATFPPDAAKRIVIMSDGNENMGDVMPEVEAAVASGVNIDVVPMWYKHDREVYFDRMIAPAVANEQERINIRLILESTRRSKGRLAFRHNGKLVDLDPDPDQVGQAVEMLPGKNVFHQEMLLVSGGVNRFEAEFIPDDRATDEVPQNNVATAFTFVHSKAKALVLTMDPIEDEIFARELRRNQVETDLRSIDDFAVDLLSLSDYNAVILSNVPANVFTEPQQKAIASYVKDLGGGLIMTGGPEGFGAGGWIGSPVEEVMPVTFEIKHRRVIPRGALVLILHSCEMDRGNYWGEQVAIKSLDTISSRDYIGVLAYSWNPGGVNWEVPIQLATNKAAVKAKIKKVQIGDMPDFAQTMSMAVTGLQATDAAQKHIIIISDGDPAPPSAATLQQMVNSKITCSTVGIGFGVHVMEATLKNIAETTGGNYYAVRNPKRLPQIFTKEAKVVRRPLISEEPFQPKLVYALAETITGIQPSEIPPLGGMVLTSPKPLIEMPLVRQTSDGTDPVLAHWEHGLGKAVAFSSGYWKHWGDDWTEWEKFGKLWSQVVRWAMRSDQSPDFEVHTKLVGDKGQVVIEAVNKEVRFLNFLRLHSRVIGPDQEAKVLDFAQTGVGRYEATFDVEDTGQYIAQVNVRGQEQEDLGMILTGLSVPFSPEYRQLETNESILREIVDRSGGRWLEFDPETDDVYSHANLLPVRSRRPVWEWLLTWIILPLFLLDVAVRRLASILALSVMIEVLLAVVLLFGVGFAYQGVLDVAGVLVLCEIIGWSIRYRSIRPTIEFFTHPVVALARAGDRSRVSLDQLKTKREEILGQMSQPPVETHIPGRRRISPSGMSEHQANAAARFDLGEPQAGTRAGNLHAALGGAQTVGSDQAAGAKQAKVGDKDADEGQRTSKLFEAKRRAQQEMEARKKSKE